MARKVIVAVHGIGDQFRYETIQSVANQVCQYFGQPAAVPLGRFHSTLFVEEQSVQDTLAELRKAIAALQGAPGGSGQPVNPPVTPPPPAALVLKSPPGPALPVDFGFAEVYWADVPRKPAKDEHILEEVKKWTRTLVERIRLQYQPKFGNVKVAEESYAIAATVIAEMIETVAVLERLSFVAEKAGVFRFDLKKVLIDYLGDVQVVTEYSRYRKQILKAFDKVMTDINATMGTQPGGAAPEPFEIYIVAHSEGTVIAFMGLLEALSKGYADRPAWIDNVKGFMTIGSPINKHLILWPDLWTDWKPRARPAGQPATAKIKWRNYYDYGDPIGFELKKTREWLREEGWAQFFDFEDNEGRAKDQHHDIGFARYPFPGKAHNDYWHDEVVFGHFIQTVVEPKQNGELVTGPTKGVVPRSNVFWWILSSLLPYGLAAALCYLGIYLLYKGVLEFIVESQPPLTLLKNVLGLTGLLASLIVIARIPRLTLLWRWKILSWLLLLAAAGLYWGVVKDETKEHLVSCLPSRDPHDPFANTARIVGIVALLALLTHLVSGRSAYWGGTRALVILAGTVSCAMAYNVIRHAERASDSLGPVWPLLLAGAACFYLWWLAALIFDLSFVWHRYIRHAVVEDRLRELQPK